jgi:hypothetical protein
MCADNELVCHHKDMPPLSPSRTVSALRAREWLGVLRERSSVRSESQPEGDK